MPLKKRKAKRKATKRKRNPLFGKTSVYDSTGKLFVKAKRGAAKIIARAIGGSITKPRKQKNPLTSRFTTVRARRLPNGKVQLAIPGGRRRK